MILRHNFRRAWFHLLAILCGFTLIGLLIHGIGFSSLWSQLRILGWALVPLILIEGVADLCHTQAWRHCLSDALRKLPFFRIFCVRMAGYSISYLTPTAGMGGEVAKGVLLASDSTGSESATGIIIDKLSYALAQLIFVVGGSLITLPGAGIPRPIWISMLIATTLLGAGMFIFLAMQKYGKLGGFFRWLVSHRLGGRRMQKAAALITDVDEKLRGLLYKTSDRPRALHVLAHSRYGVGYSPVLLFSCGLDGQCFVESGRRALVSRNMVQPVELCRAYRSRGHGSYPGYCICYFRIAVISGACVWDYFKIGAGFLGGCRTS